MKQIKLIKLCYHLFCFLLLFYLAFYLSFVNLYIRISLFIISLFHLYDAWWFYYHDSNAPI